MGHARIGHRVSLEMLERLFNAELLAFHSDFEVQPVPIEQDLRAGAIGGIAAFAPEAVTLEAGFSCSHWTIFSMATSRPAWRSTVSCTPNLRALLGAGCDFQAPGIAEHPGTPPAPIPLSETAGLGACGETGMVGLLDGPVVAIRSGPTIPIVTVRSGHDGLDPDVVGVSCITGDP